MQSVDIVKTKLSFSQHFINHLGQKSFQPLDFGVRLRGGDGSSDGCNGKLFPLLLSGSPGTSQPLCGTPGFTQPAAGSELLPGRTDGHGPAARGERRPVRTDLGAEKGKKK